MTEIQDELQVSEAAKINVKKAAQFYSAFVGQGDLVFDIGPHEGEYSEVFLKKGAKVLAVEPRPVYQKLLNKLFEGNPHFMIHQAAVGGKMNMIPMPEDRITPVIAALPYADEQQYWQHVMTSSNSKTVDIQIVTLDELIRLYGLPAFCKVNIEGFSAEVLRGLSQPIPAIAIDFASYNLERIAEVIRQLFNVDKYEFNWSKDGNFKLEEKVWMNAKALHASIAEYRKSRIEGVLFARIAQQYDEV
jgi:FkbM family methyltransferase